VFLYCSCGLSRRVFTHHSVDCPPTTSSLLVYLRHVKVHCDLPVRYRCASFSSFCTNTLLCDTEFFQYALDFSPTLVRANRTQDTLVLAVCISRQSDLTSRFSSDCLVLLTSRSITADVVHRCRLLPLELS